MSSRCAPAITPYLPNVAKKWSWPFSVPATKSCIDHAWMIASKNVPVVGIADAAVPQPLEATAASVVLFTQSAVSRDEILRAAKLYAEDWINSQR